MGYTFHVVILSFLKKLRWLHSVKVSVFPVFLVLVFPHSDWIRRDMEDLSVFSPNAGKNGPQKLWESIIICKIIDSYIVFVYDFANDNKEKLLEKISNKTRLIMEPCDKLDTAVFKIHYIITSLYYHTLTLLPVLQLNKFK